MRPPGSRRVRRSAGAVRPRRGDPSHAQEPRSTRARGRGHPRERRPGCRARPGRPVWQRCRGEIRAEVARLRAGSWVRSVGYVPDDVLIALVGAATAVALSVALRGLGLPILEAMACGAIVVAADLASISEVARDGVILVDPESDDRMASALLAALTDRDVRARLAEAGPALAATFDWDRCATATVDAYRRALAS